MNDKEIITFFENLIKRFYDADSEFKRFFDDGAQELLGWKPMYVDNYVCTIETGSERACLLFDGIGLNYNEIVDDYAIKLSLDYLCDGECIQMERELNNYQLFKDIHCEKMVAGVMKGDKITELFGMNDDSDAHIYIVERADVSEEEYDDVLYNYVEKNIENFEVPHYWLWPRDDANSFYDLDEEERIDYIGYLLEDYDNESKYEMLLDAFDISINDNKGEFWQLLEDIGDLHSGNISVCRGRPIIVDYGFDAYEGGKFC